MSNVARFIDPVKLGAIKDLRLLARTVVRGVTAGIHRGPNTGSSIEFAQYRAYTQGDDLRLLDWKLYGRTDRLYVKQFQEETGLRASILLDCSASMVYGSGGMAKFDYARMLAAALATLLDQQGDAVGLTAFHHELITHRPPSTDPRKFRDLFAELARLEAERETDAAKALAFVADVLPARGMVILISDLIQPLEEVIDRLKSLRAQRHDVLVFQITDARERDFGFEHAITLLDAESDGEQFVVPSAVRGDYLANRERHYEAIQNECSSAAIDLVELLTDQPLDFALRSFLHHRNRVLAMRGRVK